MTSRIALQWGLVNQVVPPADLLDAALILARQVSGAAPLAVAAVLEVTAATAGLDIAAGFRLLRSGDLATYAEMLGSADALEGPRAFTEKRPPRWIGS